MNPLINLFEWLEDFDNEDLEPDEHMEQLYDAVTEYNERNGTTYNQSSIIMRYQTWLENKGK